MLTQSSQPTTSGPIVLRQDTSKWTNFNTLEMITIVDTTVVCNVVCLLGIASNIVNLVIITRQGFTDSVNISLLGLTISDMSGLVSLLWANLCSNPLIIKFVDPPYSASEFCFMPAGSLRVVFSRMACYMTIFITVQRCLCISLPLQVRSLMTPCHTTWIMVAIPVVVFFLHSFALSCTGVAYIGWKPDPFQNKSILGLITSENFQEVYNIGIFITAFFQLTSFLAIILFTTILVYQLRQNTKWRHSVSASSSVQAAAHSSRSQKLGLMIVLLSAILIACYTPSTIALILSLCFTNASNVQSPDETFNFLWTLGFLCEAVKSSVNICVYYKMSSKYRSTFNLIFSKHTKDTQRRRHL